MRQQEQETDEGILEMRVEELETYEGSHIEHNIIKYSSNNASISATMSFIKKYVFFAHFLHPHFQNALICLQLLYPHYLNDFLNSGFCTLISSHFVLFHIQGCSVHNLSNSAYQPSSNTSYSYKLKYLYLTLVAVQSLNI